MKRPTLYLCAPFSTATLAEKLEVIHAKRKALALGWTPIFLPHALSDALDDIDPEQRKVALECCASFVPKCDAFLLVCPRLTEGVRLEISAWQDGAAIFFEDANSEKPSFKWPQLPSVEEWNERKARRERKKS